METERCFVIGFEDPFHKAGKPTLLANSLIRRSPASEDNSPPLKFILIRLLLSRDVVVKIAMRAPSSGLFDLDNPILPDIELFFMFICQMRAKSLKNKVTMRLLAAITVLR